SSETFTKIRSYSKMRTIKIRGQSVDVDIVDELSDHTFDNARWQAGKLIASSPFRQERAPSFFVNLEGEYAGTWGDSGAHDDEYAKGNFVKLIALLNDIAYEDAERYILDKYGVTSAHKPDELIRLKTPKLMARRAPNKPIINSVTPAISPYLSRRGISADVQIKHGIGYNEAYPGYTAMPIRTAAGEVANVFYRRSSFRDKRFHYERGAAPKNRLLFGAHMPGEEAILVEGIIDALSWETVGYPAYAVGGARISREQVEIIKRSPTRRIYVAGDNDEQGRMFNRQVIEVLRGYVELYAIDYSDKKDANAALMSPLGVREMYAMIDEASPIQSMRIRAYS